MNHDRHVGDVENGECLYTSSHLSLSPSVSGRVHSTDVLYKHKLQMDMGLVNGDVILEKRSVAPIETPLAPHGSAGPPPAVLSAVEEEGKAAATHEQAEQEATEA